MFISELQELDSSHVNVAFLRTGVMAEAPCPTESMKRVVSAMHCPEMVIGYGQTGSTPINTMSRADDDVEVRCMTVGLSTSGDRGSHSIVDYRANVARLPHSVHESAPIRASPSHSNCVPLLTSLRQNG